MTTSPRSILTTILTSLAVTTLAVQADLPADNPITAHYAKTPDAVPAWLNQLPWDRVISIAELKNRVGLGRPPISAEA